MMDGEKSQGILAKSAIPEGNIEDAAGSVRHGPKVSGTGSRGDERSAPMS